MEQPSKLALQQFFHTENLPNTHKQIMKFVTEYLMKKHHFDKESDINTGWCFQWAYFVWCLHPNPKEITFHRFGAYGHVVIKFQNKYYDCLTQKGVKTYMKFVDSYGHHYLHDSCIDMCNFWLSCGNSKIQFLKILQTLNPESGFNISQCDDDW